MAKFDKIAVMKKNRLGMEGWELVAVFDCRLYLKREYKE